MTRVPQARDLLSHHAFETPAATGVSQDYNKPLIIPAGSDSFQVSSTSTSQHLVCVASTTLLSSQAILGGGEVVKMEVMKHQFSTHFPQKETETLTMSEDPAKDPNFRVRVGITASCQCQCQL